MKKKAYKKGDVIFRQGDVGSSFFRIEKGAVEVFAAGPDGEEKKLTELGAGDFIGEMAVVLEGKVDAIVLTGGLLRFDDVVEGIRQRCGWIAPVATYPGENEQEAMALGALRVLRGEETARTYSGRPVWEGFPDEQSTMIP